MKRVFLLCIATLPLLPATSMASTISADAINMADYTGGALPDGQNALTAKVQILLDRHHASPGVIDGYAGSNVDKAIRGVEAMFGLPEDGVLDADVWKRISEGQSPAIVSYTISEEDVADISASLPEDYAELAKLDWLGFTSVAEKVAETFHMDLDFLSQLNPGAGFTEVGEKIWVVDTGDGAKEDVARIVVDKKTQRLLAFGPNDQIIAGYPVTIGSKSLPSPAGQMEVTAVAIEPTYSYRPEANFKQGDNDEALTLPPGPNGPVGIVWIDLSKPTYGLHGTPEPAEIDKTFSHGCVRMTNWDAHELANLVSAGVPVEFVE